MSRDRCLRMARRGRESADCAGGPWPARTSCASRTRPDRCRCRCHAPDRDAARARWRAHASPGGSSHTAARSVPDAPRSSASERARHLPAGCRSPVEARCSRARPSVPATRTSPAVGASKPVSSLMVVDFPEPFGPRKPNSVPAATCKFRSRTAITRPNVLVTPRASMPNAEWSASTAYSSRGLPVDRRLSRSWAITSQSGSSLATHDMAHTVKPDAQTLGPVRARGAPSSAASQRESLDHMSARGSLCPTPSSESVQNQ